MQTGCQSLGFTENDLGADPHNVTALALLDHLRVQQIGMWSLFWIGKTSSIALAIGLIPLRMLAAYGQSIVMATLAIPGMILGQTALSFLGLVIRPPLTR